MGAFFAILFIAFVAFVAIVGTIQNIIYICQPNEVLIFSGTAVGKKGYRIIKGGRGTRIPLFETVDRMDLTNMPIEVSVEGAYSKGGIPLIVQGVANVKIAGESPALDNAIQRFLGKPRDRIMRVAKETLEGNLRGVLATLTPEEVNGEKDKFSRELQKEAEEGLHKLGLTLDTLKIQNVSDDSGYLNSIGRKQTAEIVKSARISEAQNKAQSLIQSAQNKQQSELAKLDAELSVARAESERRVRNAESMQQALVAEQQGQVQALVARARAELMLQDARVEQVRSKLEAEVVAPARAQSEADLAKARGEAAKIVENGKAQATALSELARQWKKMGSSAREIFLMQKLDAILPIYLSSIRSIKVDKLTMLQPGVQGSGNLVGSIETLRAGGIDVARAFQKWAGVEGSAIPADEPAPSAAAPIAANELPPLATPVARKVQKGK
ncbi:MAG: flotillin family protein [Planctomycetota bacterium]